MTAKTAMIGKKSASCTVFAFVICTATAAKTVDCSVFDFDIVF